ncbi:phenylacetate--CoA ligase family protein [Candidatus Kaiserbacteria bacterium]|nr:phenylacetate--CoA ligase family protein [Candidatus Kaiserbacteria bacterium]
MRRLGFSPRWNEIKRSGIHLLSEVLLPYREPYGFSHRLVTAAYRRLLTETEYADSRQVENLQLLRLKKILKTAGKIPWWKDHFANAGLVLPVSKLNDLEKLPPVTKYSFSGISRAQFASRFFPGHPRLLLHRTSGTTGAPFEWGVDRNTLFVETASYLHRAITWFGIPIRGKYPFIATFVYWSYAVPGIEMWWNPVASSEPRDFVRMLRMMRENNSRVLFSYPTNLLLFAKKLSELRERVPLELALATGQRLNDEDRAYVEKALGCPVGNLYGSREFGQMAIECPQRHHWYHINSERLLVEITDEVGKRLPDGVEGIITITSLENHAMPLIRYQLGDRGRIIPETCPCGRTLPLLEFFGKDMDFIRLPNGGIIPFRHINLVVLLQFFDEIEFYQIVQASLYRLIIRLKLKNRASPDFEKRFLQKLRVYVGNELDVSFEYPDSWNISEGRKMKVFIPLATY